LPGRRAYPIALSITEVVTGAASSEHPAAAPLEASAECAAILGGPHARPAAAEASIPVGWPEARVGRGGPARRGGLSGGSPSTRASRPRSHAREFLHLGPQRPQAQRPAEEPIRADHTADRLRIRIRVAGE